MSRLLLRQHIISVVCGLLTASDVGGQVGRAALAGTVFDSVHAAPLARAIVTLAQKPSAGIAGDSSARETAMFESTATDDLGRFRFDSLVAGRYAAMVQHPWLDSAGLGGLAAQVELVANEVGSLTLAVPAPATLRARLCRAARSNGGSAMPGAIAGVLFDGDGHDPVGGAEIILRWDAVALDSGTRRPVIRQLQATLRADASGAYRVCGVPSNIPIAVEGRLPAGGATGVVEGSVEPGGMWLLPLRASTRATGVVAGAVRTLGGTPVPHARISVFGTETTVTAGPDGSFRITAVRSGTICLQVSAIGYVPSDVIVDASSAADPKINVSPLAVVLAPVHVAARRAALAERLSGLEDRRAHPNGGYLLTEDSITKRSALFTIDLFRHVPGVLAPQPGRVGTPATLLSAIQATAAGQPCPLTIFLDGMRQSRGFDLNSLQPDDIHAIEVYASSADVPAEFDGSSPGFPTRSGRSGRGAGRGTTTDASTASQPSIPGAYASCGGSVMIWTK